MNAKERFYSGLAKETIGKITSNTDNWTSFLRTMSRNYEFTYPEQVMIYGIHLRSAGNGKNAWGTSSDHLLYRCQ